jgi:hypothetical protein
MDNTAWRMQGIPLRWDLDPELNCWLLIGGGDLTDQPGRGITFGEWVLELTDCYIAGRDGTHRPGRRFDLVDMRLPTVARTTFGAPFSGDYSNTARFAHGLQLPGDSFDIYSGSAITFTTGPHPPDLARPVSYQSTTPPQDGVVATFATTSQQHEQPQPGLGDIRVFSTGEDDVSDQGSYVFPVPQTAGGDLEPETSYGWERILGPVTNTTRGLAVDNGIIRVRWVGWQTQWTLRWTVEIWRGTTPGPYGDGYRPLFEFESTAAPNSYALPVEITPERTVIEWGPRIHRCRFILQRGWAGPRVEIDKPGDGVAAQLLLKTSGFYLQPPDIQDSTPSWVKRFPVVNPDREVFAAPSDTTVTVIQEQQSGFMSPGPFAVQFALSEQHGPGLSSTDLAALSLDDSRSIPVLVAR